MGPLILPTGSHAVVRVRLVRCVVFFFVLTASFQAAADMYIWTDEKGVIVISEKPPREAGKAVRVVRTGPSGTNSPPKEAAAQTEPVDAIGEIQAAARRIESTRLEDLGQMDRERLKTFIGGDLARDCSLINGTEGLERERRQMLVEKCGVLQEYASRQFFFNSP